jgi:arylsulfatase
LLTTEPPQADGRSHKIIADVEIKDADASGVILAHGSRFGSHTLFLKDRRLHYVYNIVTTGRHQGPGGGPLAKYRSTASLEKTQRG